MKGLIAIVIVLALVMFVEIFPYMENTVVSAGERMADSLNTTTPPDTSQLGGTKALIWGAAGIIVILGIFVELTDKRSGG